MLRTVSIFLRCFHLAPTFSSYFYASQPFHARSEIPSHSFQRSSQAISTFYTSSTLVRHSCLAPSSGAFPKLFPRFTSHPRSSGTPVSLLPAELPHAISTLQTPSMLSGTPELTTSYFHASHPIHARRALLSCFFLRSSPQTISIASHPIRSAGTPVSLLPAELLSRFF